MANIGRPPVAGNTRLPIGRDTRFYCIVRFLVSGINRKSPKLRIHATLCTPFEAGSRRRGSPLACAQGSPRNISGPWQTLSASEGVRLHLKLPHCETPRL